jgi:hypothetical protein
MRCALSIIAWSLVLASCRAEHVDKAVGLPLRLADASTEAERAIVRALDIDLDGTATMLEAFQVPLLVGDAPQALLDSWMPSILQGASPTDSWEPWQRHLGVANGTGNVMITWTTVSPYSGAGASVKVAPLASGSCPEASSPTAWTSVHASSSNYSVPVRWYNPTGSGGVWIHRAAAAPVPPGKDFCYQTGGIEPSSGQWYGGTKAPLVGQVPRAVASDSAIQIALFADQGTIALLGFAVEALAISEAGWDSPSSQAASVLARIRGVDVESVLSSTAGAVGPSDSLVIVGDIAYAGIAINVPWLNITSNDEWEPIWDVYGQMIEPMASKRHFEATLGNHDNFYGATAVEHRYPIPGSPVPPPPPPQDRWFTWTEGPVRFISMSSENPYEKGTVQWLWIQQQLSIAQAQRATTPWVILLVHRPMLCSDADEYDSHRPGSPINVALEPLFSQYQAPDMVVSGHQHAFEVSNPTINGTVVKYPVNITTSSGEVEPAYVGATAPVHVMMGSAGAVQEEQWVEPQPLWSHYRIANTLDSYGYGVFNVFNSTHARYNFRPLTGTPGFSFWIIR